MKIGKIKSVWSRSNLNKWAKKYYKTSKNKKSQLYKIKLNTNIIMWKYKIQKSSDKFCQNKYKLKNNN